MCLLYKRNELTLAEIEYEQAIRHEGVLWWKELELHRGRMQELEKKIKELRENVESLLRTTNH